MKDLFEAGSIFFLVGKIKGMAFRKNDHELLEKVEELERLLDDFFGINICPVCGKNKNNSCDIEAIKKLGECLGCDHVRADR